MATSLTGPSIQGVTFGHGPSDDLWFFTLLDGARSFAAIADAAVARLGRPDASGPHYLTVLFLLSQAIENALKSYLLIRGIPEKELMKIGHHLPRVLARAETAEWRTRHPSDRFLLKVIDSSYRSQKRLQYHRASEMTLPLLRPVRELVQEYIGRLRTPVLHECVANDLPPNASTAGWSIDPDADYGGPTLDQFRQGVPPSGQLSDLTEMPAAKTI
jgi:hypothetical protein